MPSTNNNYGKDSQEQVFAFGHTSGISSGKGNWNGLRQVPDGRGRDWRIGYYSKAVFLDAVEAKMWAWP